MWADCLTLESAPCPTLGNEYGRTLPFTFLLLSEGRGEGWEGRVKEEGEGRERYEKGVGREGRGEPYRHLFPPL